MLKHLGCIFFLLLGAAVWYFSLAPRQYSRGHFTGAKKLRIVTSGYVPYTLAKQLAADRADVSMLLPANAEPHSFEPTPGALLAVRGADILLYMSDRLEPWAKDIASGADKQTLVLKAADFAAPSDDPHVWMDFENMKQMAAAVTAALVKTDPANQAYFETNLKMLDEELAALDEAYKKGLANCQSREVVHVGHLAFKNLTKNYNLSLSALAGASHDGEHSVRKIAELVKFIKDNKVQAIFTEETLSPRLSEAVAGETGAQILPLYTVEHVSKDDFDKNVTYGDFMRRNLDSLSRGLACQA